MSQGSAYIAVDGAPMGQAPAGACCHQRAVITGAAAPLGTFITAIGQAYLGIPYRTATHDPNIHYYPKAVNLQIESGTDVVYMTTDGHDTALGDVTAALGMNIIPVAPSWTRVPVSCDPTVGANSTGLIRVLASAGSINVQCVFEF